MSEFVDITAGDITHARIEEMIELCRQKMSGVDLANITDAEFEELLRGGDGSTTRAITDEIPATGITINELLAALSDNGLKKLLDWTSDLDI